ncbi:MAG: hypothetical protein WC384_09425 [Prolixibacteraceae bacterium]|jgi:hypothetical protein
MNSKKPYRLAIAALVLLGACSPALYLPTLADADLTGVSTDSLLIGRTLYVNNCGSCHNLHLPEQFTRRHWEKEIPEMRQKAKISAEEAKLITNFILARCKPD